MNIGYQRPLRAECSTVNGYTQAIAVRVIQSRWLTHGTNDAVVVDWSMVDFTESDAILEARTNWPLIQYMGGR